MAIPERIYVLFASSFRYDQAPNISHETLDGQRTLCGRKVSDAQTVEPDNNGLEPDCGICRKASRRLRATALGVAVPATEEAQLRCGSCARDHSPGQLREPCRVTGCECWCNR